MLKLNGLKLLHFKNSQDAQTVDIPLPKTVKIPMQQHMGAPCVPVVKVGDQVLVGQLIGNSDQPFSVPVHSSVSGTVTALEDYVTSGGAPAKRVVVETDGLQTPVECSPHTVTNQEELVKAARTQVWPVWEARASRPISSWAIKTWTGWIPWSSTLPNASRTLLRITGK